MKKLIVLVAVLLAAAAALAADSAPDFSRHPSCSSCGMDREKFSHSRVTWTEEGPGCLEMDTVALCGGRLHDRYLWMLDAVDSRTGWTEMRALENRGQHCTLGQISHLEQSLPFALLGLDSDNGGEFINHHLAAYLGQRPKPVLFTRGRAYHSNDNARVEQRNWTHVRQHFGYERYDNPQVAPMINGLCEGALGQLLNHFLPTHLLKEKRRKGKRTVRIYGPALTPYARVLAFQEVSPIQKAQLQKLHEQLNPFALARQVEQPPEQVEVVYVRSDDRVVVYSHSWETTPTPTPPVTGVPGSISPTPSGTPPGTTIPVTSTTRATPQPTASIMPEARFSGSPREGSSPLTVQFDDLSTGDPDSWLWKFGDGRGSPEPKSNPRLCRSW